MKLVMRLAVNVFALLVVAYIVPGFAFVNIQSAIVAAVVIGVVNTFIKPILQLVTLPISIITLGISAFLVNVFLLWGVSRIVPGFIITNLTAAIIGSIALALTSWFLHKIARE